MNYKKSRTNHGDGYFTVLNNEKHSLEHRVIAEIVLGKPLPPKAELHHVNGQKGDNNSNINQDTEDNYRHIIDTGIRHCRTKNKGNEHTNNKGQESSAFPALFPC